MTSPRIEYPLPPLHHRSAVYRPVAPKAVTAILAWAFVVGTGGMSTPTYFQHKLGYQFAQIPVPEDLDVGIRPPAENLKRIRAVFKPSVSDLANLLRVSRQTIYNWMGGENPSLESADRLEDLAKAADLIEAHGVNTSTYLLRRKIRDGKTLIDIAMGGGSAHDAARSLVRILDQEAAERDLLKSRLDGRQYAKRDNSEFGIPMLDENIGS
jgi:transcriptional regulator with XRE-family HTH domain